ncbi:hypothetical protein ECAE60S_00751 [Eoetvoesiella caeni]
MGGLGSGQWSRLERKATTNQYQKLDVRQMHKDGWLMPLMRISLQGSRGLRVLSVFEQELLIEEGGSRQSISLMWRPCHFGGKRLTLLCPYCCARLGYVLYHRGGAYRCRRCAGLSYPSQQENVYLRSVSRANRVRAKIDPGNTVMFPIPVKPKGMHKKTYQRLIAQVICNEGEIGRDGCTPLKGIVSAMTK